MVTAKVVKMKTAPGGKDDKMTRVDGKGLWSSWQRNFANKLLALLDLVDNSLDAAVQSQEDRRRDGDSDFVGRVHVYPDQFRDDVTGLCIVNNCVKPIRPLSKVLEVYNSSKVDSGAGDIGENGVGLKQGCATLSDLSFVLVKNGGDDKIELGFCAESLQLAKGCYLPAFKLSNKKGDDSLRNQLMSLFSQQKHADVASCVARYGAASSRDVPSLETGIDRLCRHFDHICNNFFGNPYVFMVVMDKVQGNQTKEQSAKKNDTPQKTTVNRLMKELAGEIDRHYIHIPDDFQFLIDGKRMAFKYWPSRLVELSEFTVNVNKSIDWEHKMERPDHRDTYGLRVLIGFDGLRVTGPESGKTCSLYYYSRQSGRLITSKTDARLELGVTAGGTFYCQGLTVIVDDYRGNLPLNPTKQDIAFGEEVHGDVHKDNLNAWIGAVTHFYYNYHIAKFNDKKTDLTQKIAKYGDVLLQQNRKLKTIDSSELTTFHLSFKAVGKKIRVDKSSAQEIVGPDTLYRLKKSEKKAQKASSAPKGKKRKAAAAAASDTIAAAPTIPRRRGAVSYRETESADEEEEEAESVESSSAKPAAKQNARKKKKSSQAGNEMEAVEEETDDDDGHTKEYYKDLCKRLTDKRLRDKEKIKELRVELENERNLRQVAEQQLKKKTPTAAALSGKENGRKKAPPKSPPKRKSPGKAELLPCPEIGEGWMKQIVKRGDGGQYKIYHNAEGKKFRSMAEVKRHLGES